MCRLHFANAVGWRTTNVTQNDVGQKILQSGLIVAHSILHVAACCSIRLWRGRRTVPKEIGFSEGHLLLWDCQEDPYNILMFDTEADDLNQPIPAKELALELVSDKQRWMDIGFIQFLFMDSRTQDEFVQTPLMRTNPILGGQGYPRVVTAERNPSGAPKASPHAPARDSADMNVDDIPDLSMSSSDEEMETDGNQTQFPPAPPPDPRQNDRQRMQFVPGMPAEPTPPPMPPIIPMTIAIPRAADEKMTQPHSGPASSRSRSAYGEPEVTPSVKQRIQDIESKERLRKEVAQRLIPKEWKEKEAGKEDQHNRSGPSHGGASASHDSPSGIMPSNPRKDKAMMPTNLVWKR